MVERLTKLIFMRIFSKVAMVRDGQFGWIDRECGDPSRIVGV